MMESSEDAGTPLWHLLPHQPAAFFSLSPGFDRKDLKRAYNAYLRVFKPDRYPAEFQKLRAAYEQLDLQLRYGTDSPASPAADNVDQWTQSSAAGHPPNEVSSKHDLPPAHDAPSEHSDALAHLGSSEHDDPGCDDPSKVRPLQTSPARSLSQRLETETPQALYEELQRKPQAPFDFYALALLSDSIAEPRDSMFLEWLLAGLKKHREHPALTQLLIAYLQNGVIADDQLENVLLAVSRAVPTDRFYSLTEHLFDRLCLSVTWDRLEEVLNACSHNIVDYHERGRVVFMCHLVRHAMWMAPWATSEKIFAYLNEHPEYFGGNLEYELELNLRLFQYVKQRGAFKNKGPIAFMIDRALLQYCMKPSGDGDHEIVTAQVHIAQHPEQLFSEFRLTPEENMQVLIPWIWISDEVEQRLQARQQPTTPNNTVTATLQMLKQIDLNFPHTPLHIYKWLNNGLLLGIILPLVFILPLIVMVVTNYFHPPSAAHFPVAAIALGFSLAAAFWFFGRKRTVDVWMMKYLQRLFHQHYMKWWRSLVGRFFAATHFRYDEVDKAIVFLISQRREELNVSAWLPHFYKRDVALYLYASAVRFLR